MTHEIDPGSIESEADIPRDHPRYQDLLTRFRIEEGVRSGITHLQGMHAEGRGSAFDYLLGEETIPSADDAARAAAASLLLAKRPVISVNGNVAALVPAEIGELAAVTEAAVEVNLFHRTEDRIARIISHLNDHGVEEVLGSEATARIPGLDHDRGLVSADGIYAGDVVLIPLEDGDRAAALQEMGKREIVIDLNPLSRSQRAADIPIVDNVIRAIPGITEHARELMAAAPSELETILSEFDSEEHLASAEERIRSGDLEHA